MLRAPIMQPLEMNVEMKGPRPGHFICKQAANPPLTNIVGTPILPTIISIGTSHRPMYNPNLAIDKDYLLRNLE